jgi:hypothetical protein
MEQLTRFLDSPTQLEPIFINYRRDDTGWESLFLHSKIAERFGSGRVFHDVNSLKLGDDFLESVNAALSSCGVLLALIGESWLSIAGPDGERRLDDPDDLVRREIETALARRVVLIPVLVDAASMPRPTALPESIAALSQHQAHELRNNSAPRDADHLLTVLEDVVPTTQVADKALISADLAQAMLRPDPGTGRIFISYRRNDALYAATALSQRLAERFGDANVAMDVEDIQIGEDLMESIARTVTSCAVQLVVIGDKWIDMLSKDPSDLIRSEIELALMNDIPIVPILIDSVAMPRAEDLPPSIAPLAHSAAIHVRSTHFQEDVGVLCDAVQSLLPSVGP